MKYCIDAQTVYVGQAAVWDQYTRFGDAAPAVIAAHEVTLTSRRFCRCPSRPCPTTSSATRTIEERLKAFDLAYLSQNQQPMAECVPFVPEVPIIN